MYIVNSLSILFYTNIVVEKLEVVESTQSSVYLRLQQQLLARRCYKSYAISITTYFTIYNIFIQYSLRLQKKLDASLASSSKRSRDKEFSSKRKRERELISLIEINYILFFYSYIQIKAKFYVVRYQLLFFRSLLLSRGLK